MFRFLKDEKGASAIISAVMAFVVIGIAAVALDTGNVLIQKRRLQNAVDAAALAAAQKLPDTSQAAAAAGQYVRMNGFSPSRITVSFSNNKSVTIHSSMTVQYTFARVLGLTEKTVDASAKAEIALMGEAFDYVIFSGSKTADLDLNGSKYDIGGSIHTNASFKSNGSGLTITGACEAAGSITISGGNVGVPTRIPGAGFVSMPDFSDMIRQQAQEAGQYYAGDKTFYGSSIDVSKPIFVDGNITINGSGFKGVGCLVATGSITFNGSSQNISSNDAVCIYSKTGNIHINGSSSVVEGILYAPNGQVAINGSHQTVNGRIIADTVSMNGSDYSITVKGDIDDLKCLPPNTVKLVR